MTHWCRDISRDEAVRASEDGRSGPLPTLEECIERQKHAAMTAGVKEGFVKADGEWKRLTDDELRQLLVIPKSVSASSAVEPENKGDSMATNGLRTERVTLEITHDVAGYPLASWDWRDILRCARYNRDVCESVRVVEETKLAPAANADGGSNHAAPAASVNSQGILDSSPAASGAAGTEPVAWGFMAMDGVIVHVSTFEPVPGTATVVPLYAAPPPAKGWLTAEEREALAFSARKLRELANQQYRNGDEATATDTSREADFVDGILDRSSPPEVVLPNDKHYRDADWLEALAAAGVTVKEVW